MYELLLVDDEVSCRSILASCFPWNELGFHICAQMDDGQAALEYLKTNPVHVILSDISMPHLDGIALAKAVSELPGPRPKIVLLTAYDKFSYAQSAIRYGVRDYVLKPTNFTELRELFQTVCMELDNAYRQPAKSAEPQNDEIIQEVMAYCAQNYRDGSLSALAEKLYLTPSYLSQLIKAKTSENFSDFINKTKMKQAALFLQDPKIKIYNISSLVGYVNPNNFTRAFKAYWGLTPTEYKAQKDSSHEKTF